jgi:hypothetical protein
MIFKYFGDWVIIFLNYHTLPYEKTEKIEKTNHQRFMSAGQRKTSKKCQAFVAIYETPQGRRR